MKEKYAKITTMLSKFPFIIIPLLKLTYKRQNKLIHWCILHRDLHISLAFLGAQQQKQSVLRLFNITKALDVFVYFDDNDNTILTFVVL